MDEQEQDQGDQPVVKARKAKPVSVLQLLDAEGQVIKDGLSDETLKENLEDLGPGTYVLRRYTDREFAVVKKESKTVKGL